MFKTLRGRRLLGALVLGAAVLTGGVRAASAQTITNPGFETGTESGWLSGGAVHGVSTTNTHSGTYKLYNNGGWNSVYQTVSGLTTNKAYTLTVWARLSTAVSGNNQSLFYSQDGGTTRIRQFVTGTAYTQFTFNFTTTTNTSIMIGSEEINGSAAIAWVDDWALASAGGTAPAAPTGLTATGGNAQVALAWTASSGATSYNALRSTVSGSGYASVATGIATTSYTNTGLTNGTTYYFVVTATNASGTSGNSNQASATPQPGIPAAPTGLAATPANAQVALTWNASTGATAYDVKRSTVSGSGYVTVSSPTATNYTNTGLTNGTTYYFVVDAKNVSGTSANSSQVSATPSAGGTNIQINCGGLAVAPFVADVDFSGGTAFTNWTGAIDTSGLTNPAPQAVYQPERYGAVTYTVPGLTAGAAYTVRLHFCENYFTVSGQRVFNVAINGTNVLTNFDIEAAAGAAHKGVIRQFAANANASGQVVIAFTNVTNNALVNGIEVTSGVSVPAAPTALVATAGNGQVALSWNASSGATSYNVLRSTVSGSGYSSVTTGVATTSYTNTGLVNGTTYYFVVQAVNSAGTSPNSAQASASPLAAPANVCTRIRFFPRSGNAGRMLNGIFTGNNQGATISGPTLYTITTTPVDGQWVDVTIPNTSVYRYLKYEGPTGSYANVAEVEFYNGNTKMAGTGFGTAGSFNNSGNTFDKALDGSTATFFDAASPDSQYVGIDLGAAVQAAMPTFSPAPGTYSTAQNVTLSTTTSGATIRYTTNGTIPTSTTGTIYTSAIPVTVTTTIRAIAYKSGLADSLVNSGGYTIGTGGGTGFSSRNIYFIGNSVTDALGYNGLVTIAQSAGKVDTWGRTSIPGAPLDWIIAHPTDGFNEAPYGLWPNALPNYHWDSVSFEPFDRHLDTDVPNIQQFMDLAHQRADNSSTIFYVYSRWPREETDGTLNYSARWLQTYTGGWDSTNETRDYFQQLVLAVRANNAANAANILMVPAGDVLYELNNRMHAGTIPGYTDITQIYADGIHMCNVGSYVVGMTFYATMYRTDPHGADYTGYPNNGGVNDRAITPALATALQTCVWDIVHGHTYSGVP